MAQMDGAGAGGRVQVVWCEVFAYVGRNQNLKHLKDLQVGRLTRVCADVCDMR